MLPQRISNVALEQKRILEMIVSHPQGIDPAVMKKIIDFTKLFWASHGNHNDVTAQKFLPEFTFEEFVAAATIAAKNADRGGGAPLKLEETL